MILYDVHTTTEPIRHYGAYPDPQLARTMQAHLSEVLHTPLVVDPVDEEPWVSRLTPSPRRAPERLADLDPNTDVLVAHVEIGALAHMTRDRSTPLCGTQEPLLDMAVGAYRLAHLMAQLCPLCAERSIR